MRIEGGLPPTPDAQRVGIVLGNGVRKFPYEIHFAIHIGYSAADAELRYTANGKAALCA